MVILNPFLKSNKIFNFNAPFYGKIILKQYTRYENYFYINYFIHNLVNYITFFRNIH